MLWKKSKVPVSQIDVEEEFNKLNSYESEKSMQNEELLNSIPTTHKRINKGYHNASYLSYVSKLDDGNINKFSNKDLALFYKDVAKDCGYNYIECNIRKTMHQFKLLKSRGYTNKDIVTMISFLYYSDQNYLDKDRLHPGILLTGWCRKIEADSKLWLDNKYSPTTSNKKLANREWVDDTPNVDTNTDTEVKIGEW